VGVGLGVAVEVVGAGVPVSGPIVSVGSGVATGWVDCTVGVEVE